MKRPVQDVAGSPRRRATDNDVAGRSTSGRGFDAAMGPLDLRDPMSTTVADAELLEDFIEFLSDEDPLDAGSSSIPDPDFRERLRSRLWRQHVMTRLPGGEEPH